MREEEALREDRCWYARLIADAVVGDYPPAEDWIQNYLAAKWALERLQA